MNLELLPCDWYGQWGQVIEAEEHEAFNWYSIDEANEEMAHKARIDVEEAEAQKADVRHAKNPMGLSFFDDWLGDGL